MSDLTIGELWAESNRIIRASSGPSAVYVAGNVGVGLLILIPGLAAATPFLSSIVSMALGYLLLTMMVQQGLGTASQARFWPYFGLAILSTLGIGLATLLLIVPGIVLFVRWSAAYGHLAVEGTGVMRSLAASYDETRGRAWPIFGTFLIPVALVVVIGIAAAAWDGLEPVVSSSIDNLVGAIAGVVITAIGLAVYALLNGRATELETVFA